MSINLHFVLLRRNIAGQVGIGGHSDRANYWFTFRLRCFEFQKGEAPSDRSSRPRLAKQFRLEFLAEHRFHVALFVIFARTSQPYSLHLTQCNFVLCPVIEFRCSRRLMAGHLLRSGEHHEGKSRTRRQSACHRVERREHRSRRRGDQELAHHQQWPGLQLRGAGLRAPEDRR
jgi:hypothetical protein